MANAQLVITSVVEFRPLKLAIGSDESAGRVVGAGQADVLAGGRLRGDGGPREFHADRPFPCGRIIGMVVEPDEVAHPIRMRIARDYDIVAYVVLVEDLECTVAVSLVAWGCRGLAGGFVKRGGGVGWRCGGNLPSQAS